MLTTQDYRDSTDLFRTELTWIVPLHNTLRQAATLPVALFHPGCLYRRNALSALEEAGIAYRVAYGSPSLAGVLAAVQAGLAVAPVTRGCRTEGCRKVTPKDGLPPIKPVGTALTKAENGSAASAAFHSFIKGELAQSQI